MPTSPLRQRRRGECDVNVTASSLIQPTCDLHLSFFARSVAHPNKADGKLEADYHQKLVMSFYAKSVSTSESIKPHQVPAPPSLML